LYARLENFSPTAQQRLLRLEKVRERDPGKAEATVLETRILLSADSGKTVFETLPASHFETDTQTLFRLSIVPVLEESEDSLEVDDTAYAVAPPLQRDRVLVALDQGVEANFLVRAVNATAGVKLVQVKELLKASDPPTVDLLLTQDDTAPPSKLSVRSRFILAPDPTESGEQAAVVSLQLGEREAPLVADMGVEWSRLKVQLTDRSALKQGEAVLLQTQGGPALTLSGQEKGLPTLRWRFPLAYSSLPLSSALPVLVGRFIDTYSRPSTIYLGGSVTTDNEFKRPGGENWEGELKLEPLALTLEGQKKVSLVPENAKQISPPAAAGFYRLASSQGKTSTVAAVNLFSYQESELPQDLNDLLFELHAPASGEPLTQAKQDVQYREAGLPLLALALLLLFVEGALFLRRGRP
jgi:hypothetical protein